MLLLPDIEHDTFFSGLVEGSDLLSQAQVKETLHLHSDIQGTDPHAVALYSSDAWVFMAGFHSGNKHRIGLDFFPSCIIRSAVPKNVENTSTLYHRGCGSQVQTGTENWYRTPMRGFNFVRSALIPCLFSIPEWKSAFTLYACTEPIYRFSAYSTCYMCNINQ